jgi:hypothetical protein
MGNIWNITFDIQRTSKNEWSTEYPKYNIPPTYTNEINVPRLCELFRETAPVYNVSEKCKMSGALILISMGHRGLHHPP